MYTIYILRFPLYFSFTTLTTFRAQGGPRTRYWQSPDASSLNRFASSLSNASCSRSLFVRSLLILTLLKSSLSCKRRIFLNNYLFVAIVSNVTNIGRFGFSLLNLPIRMIFVTSADCNLHVPNKSYIFLPSYRFLSSSSSVTSSGIP